MSESIILALELAVTFSGVFLAFMLDRFIDWRKDQKTKTSYLKLIHQELYDIRVFASAEIQYTGQLRSLYTDIWDSMVSSGDLCLLDAEQVLTLSTLYKHIKGAAFELEWFRKVADQYATIPDAEINMKKMFKNKLEEGIQIQMDKLKALQAEIDDVFQKKWWS